MMSSFKDHLTLQGNARARLLLAVSYFTSCVFFVGPSFINPFLRSNLEDTSKEGNRPAVRLCRSRFPGEPEIKGPEGPEQVL